jgi:hypothetical protein
LVPTRGFKAQNTEVAQKTDHISELNENKANNYYWQDQERPEGKKNQLHKTNERHFE